MLSRVSHVITSFEIGRFSTSAVSGGSDCVERRESALASRGFTAFWRAFVFAVASRLLGRPAQEELDLRVEAAQIVVRPALDGVQHGGIDAKEERFAIGHDRTVTDRSCPVLITGCVLRSPHSTTSRLLTIAALRSSSSWMIDFCRQHVERHFDHADRAFDDALAGGDDGAGLLPLQHGRGDFRRVGEVADARFDHFDAGLDQPIAGSRA